MRAILHAYDDIDVIGEAEDIPTAVAQIERDEPDVVVVNSLASQLNPHQMIDGLNWAGRILVIVDADTGFSAATGTVGALLKSATPKELVLALRMVAAGYSLFPSSRCNPPKQQSKPTELIRASLGPELDSLTAREYEVLRLLAQGSTNAEISATLVLSESTVKSHVQNLLGKLGMRNRVSAAIYAYEAGIVPGPRS
ncbi:DNA-binding response regulator [Pseudonocardiaceae bacterium YIM PH 21723]|nr:DNA-binding response regulator [Pseudonocardiaceae bacterium YIM PH 21723]